MAMIMQVMKIKTPKNARNIVSRVTKVAAPTTRMHA
jgi:hypothetical protein